MGALLLMSPILAFYACVLGVVGGGLVGYTQLNVPFQQYMASAISIAGVKDLFVGLLKATIFGVVIGALFLLLKKQANGNQKKEYIYAVICAALYGILNILLDFVWNTVELVIAGSNLQAAITAELTSIPATMFNAVFTVIGIAVLYAPVKEAYRRAIKE